MKYPLLLIGVLVSCCYPHRVAAQSLSHIKDVRQQFAEIDRVIASGSNAECLQLLDEVKVLVQATRALLTETKVDRREAQEKLAAIHLLRHFLDTGARPLAARLTDDRPLLDFLDWVTTCRIRYVRPSLKQRAFELAHDYSTPAAAIERSIATISRDDEFLGYMAGDHVLDVAKENPAILGAMRRITRDTLAVGKVNTSALRVLADAADTVIVADIDAALGKPGLSVGDQEELAGFKWKIEIQNPPQRLLDFLTSGQQDHKVIWHHDGTSWIVERALDRGIAHEDLRSAVRAYYQKAEPATLRHMRIIGLDRTVLEHGLLEESELPERDWVDVKGFGG